MFFCKFYKIVRTQPSWKPSSRAHFADLPISKPEHRLSYTTSSFENCMHLKLTWFSLIIKYNHQADFSSKPFIRVAYSGDILEFDVTKPFNFDLKNQEYITGIRLILYVEK